MIRRYARALTGLLICLFMQVGLLFSVMPAQAQMPVMVSHHNCSSHMVMPPDALSDGYAHKKGDQKTFPAYDKCCSVAGGGCVVLLPAMMTAHVSDQVSTRLVFTHFCQTAFTGARCAPLLRPPRSQSFMI